MARRATHINLGGVITRIVGSSEHQPVDADVLALPGSAYGYGISPGVAAGEEFTPDTVIQTTDNPQTVINANPNDGHIFEFEAGTHNIGTNLSPSANNQVFQGETNGTPVSTTPVGPNGESLGMTKTLWPAGTPISIVDGGGTASGFMVDHIDDARWTGVRIRRLKIQNFNDGTTPSGVVGGRYTTSWIIEENWHQGGHSAIKIGDSMTIRNNRFRDQLVWWAQCFEVGGSFANPIIIEDNDVADINVAEMGGVVNGAGDPQFDAGFKISRRLDLAFYAIVRRNYIRDVHGPGIWFDGYRGGHVYIYDNITVDCGIHSDGGAMPHIFYEIDPGHNGAELHNNWCLGHSAHMRVSNSHGTLTNPILVYENTVDCDDTDRQGIHLTETGTRAGGDSSAASNHPVINTVSTPDNRHFSDHVKVYDNVIRKRNTSFHTAVPIAGCQNSAAGGFDPERNYEWSGNRYEINSAISEPFKWDSNMNFATWQAQRAAQNDSQDTGPFFDTDASGADFVAWSGSKQFADTACGWEG